MPGGLLNLVAYGNQNVILNGNPSKTFFKSTYAKYTNFGLQKFRIDFDGQRTLRMTDSSTFTFTMPRYGDLLMDTYLVVNMPHIWSPVYPPTINFDPEGGGVDGENDQGIPYAAGVWQPYNFKWIKNLGAQMVERVRFTVGGQVIQEFTGQYLYNMVERDFDNAKKDLFYNMTGNTVEMNSPEDNVSNAGYYPSAFYGANSNSTDFNDVYQQVGSEPSIRARSLYIPLNIWFTMAAKMAFPLISLQYAELQIEVTIRPVQELFTVNEIFTGSDDLYLPTPIQPNFNENQYGMYRFLQPPPEVGINDDSLYVDRRTNWNADVHLISTYAFLTDDEVRVFAGQTQEYLIKEVYHTTFNDVVGTSRLDLTSIGLVSNYMWYLQRSDANERNEWSNYTNWPYSILPYPSLPVSKNNTSPMEINGQNTYPGTTTSKSLQTGLKTTGFFNPANQKDIMTSWALLLDGKYRENDFPSGLWNYIEKYVRTSGNGQDGLYTYSFSLHTDPFDFQPSGAMNMSKFSNVQFEVKTIQPTLNSQATFTTICSPEGVIVGTQMPSQGIYDYTYNLIVLEERFNVLRFQNGMAGLQFAR
tara:strand:+ start:3526 stop:5280 length:1755 start_codon:yes stop_codon:yes gene_type:complete